MSACRSCANLGAKRSLRSNGRFYGVEELYGEAQLIQIFDIGQV
jgi:hypothetical protein